MKKEYLFVYGTLMLKYPNNPFLDYLKKNTRYIGEGFTNGSLYMLESYPAFLLDSNKGKVFGEILQILNPDNFFETLDLYEGYSKDDLQNSEYKREIVVVKPLDAKLESYECWIYSYNLPLENKNIIESGNFIIFFKN